MLVITAPPDNTLGPCVVVTKQALTQQWVIEVKKYILPERRVRVLVLDKKVCC